MIVNIIQMIYDDIKKLDFNNALPHKIAMRIK